MAQTDPSGQISPVLAEQLAYYRALAPEYGDHALVDASGGDELGRALDEFAPRGDVLELACGPGTWTAALLRHASTVTAVDAAPEMLRIAAARIDDRRVRLICADLFSWRPDAQFDVVFFGFWLSHVPSNRFEEFWSLVHSCLKPRGRVFFVDDGYRSSDELVEGEHPEIIRRRLGDGTTYRAVKVPLEAVDLERRLIEIGWRIAVSPTAGPFFWGAGGRTGDAMRT